MIEVTAAYADSLAPNSATIKNAHGLVQKKKFVGLHRSEAGDLLFGECQGSGSSNYSTSADFAQPEKPVFRCTCPSRQFPCKHALGLLYAYINGQSFTEAPVPEDLAAKRDKAEKRAEKKEQEAASPTPPKPKKTNKSALFKKMSTQLEGLERLDKLLMNIINGGLGTVDQKTQTLLQGQVKELGNYYLSGAQNELRRLSLLLQDGGRSGYEYAIEQLGSMHALIKKGRTYLQTRVDSKGESAPDTESELEEWLGHVWQLSELKELGLYKEQAELLQLAFANWDDTARQEYVDTGFWLELGTNQIHRTVQYRPYKAARHIREDDSFMEVAKAKELYVYPGGLNRRVRFEEWTSRPPEAGDWQAVAAQASRSYGEAMKTVRNQLKNPLAQRSPALLLHVAETRLTDQGGYVIRDGTGAELALENTGELGRGTVELLPFVPTELLQDACMLVLFRHRPETGRLAVQPLTVINRDRMVRLLY